MTRDELIEKLKGYEWRDIEFKEASFAVPKDVYETVSAFSNTAGGHIVFGVKQKGCSFEVVGVLDVDKVQNEFITALRGGSKVSIVVPVQESAIDFESGSVLVFFIPEANRRDKPVHLDRNLGKAFVRHGSTDQHCTNEEVRRFMRDASSMPYDGEPLEDISAETCFDEEVVQWYRGEMNRREPGRHQSLNNLEFMHEWGFVSEKQGRLIPTRAGLLVFGKAKYVRQILPRPVVDYQRLDFHAAEWTPELRWSDRIVVEDNLIRAWWQLVERYMKLADRPFSLDVATLRRADEPPDYISFREAVINLLIHQDYGDHHRLSVIQIFRDQTVFMNPGDNYYTEDRLLDSGAKDVRNPAIVSAFRRIGLSDQAGTGFRAIFKNWHQLGHVPPEIMNDKAQKTFTLVLTRKPLISERQRIFQSTLGVHLSPSEAEVFALVCIKQRITVTDVRALAGCTPAEAKTLLARLVTQVLLKPVNDEECIFELQDQFKANPPDLSGSLPLTGTADLSTGQVNANSADLSTGQVKPLISLIDRQWAVLALCDVPRSLKEILSGVGVSSRGNFISKHLHQLLEAGLIARTQPESPRSPTQQYILTKKGLELYAWHLESKGGKN